MEKATGESLDEDKPLSDIRRRSLRIPNDGDKSRAGVTVGASRQSDYDWFDFFLKAGVGPHQCERYAQNFARDSMDESVLPDITTESLRTLGLKEGDILRVMKHLDTKFNRTGAKSKLRNVTFGDEEGVDGEQANGGGLFSGPGGTLRNNTRKGRPTPAVQTNDVVDAKAFETGDSEKKPETKAEPTPTPSTPADDKPVSRGFEDNAWEVKHPKQSTSSAAPAQSQPPSQPAVTGAMAELSLLTPPLQPTSTGAQQPSSQPSLSASQPQPNQPIQTQPTGANPSFFAQLGPQQTGLQNMSPQSQTPAQNIPSQQTGFTQPQQQSMPPRQRPQPPTTVQQGSLAPPPINRPTSAPQNFQQQQNAFGPPPLQPQLTGAPQAQAPQIAPPGQSLNDLNQQRFQQMQAPNQGMGQFSNGMLPQQTGFPQQQQQQTSSPFADPRPGQQLGFQPVSSQQTGFGGFSQQPMQTGSVNSTLPPALQPQSTGFQNTGVNGFGANSNMGNVPPVPPIPQQPTAAPLQAQKTGPAPAIRFGVKPEANKLAPQPTGARANLSQASKFNSSSLFALYPPTNFEYIANFNTSSAPSNPFGF